MLHAGPVRCRRAYPGGIAALSMRDFCIPASHRADGDVCGGRPSATDDCLEGTPVAKVVVRSDRGSPLSRAFVAVCAVLV